MVLTRPATERPTSEGVMGSARRRWRLAAALRGVMRPDLWVDPWIMDPLNLTAPTGCGFRHIIMLIIISVIWRLQPHIAKGLILLFGFMALLEVIPCTSPPPPTSSPRSPPSSFGWPATRSSRSCRSAVRRPLASGTPRSGSALQRGWCALSTRVTSPPFVGVRWHVGPGGRRTPRVRLMMNRGAVEGTQPTRAKQGECWQFFSQSFCASLRNLTACEPQWPRSMAASPPVAGRQSGERRSAWVLARKNAAAPRGPQRQGA